MAARLMGPEGHVLVPHLEQALRFTQRLRGLLGRDGLPSGHALLISPCGSIHTFFMRFTLDVVFLDAEYRVCRVIRGVAPNRMVWGGRRARRVVEMQAGWLDPGLCPPGVTLTLVPGAVG